MSEQKKLSRREKAEAEALEAEARLVAMEGSSEGAAPSTEGKRQTLGATKRLQEDVIDRISIQATNLIPVKEVVERKGYERGAEEYQDKEFRELLESIERDGGNTVPIDVREIIVPGVGPRYELLSGYRRVEAVRQAGLKVVLAHIRKCGDLQADRIHELENSHRKPKNLFSRGLTYSAMWSSGNYATYEEMEAATRVNKGSLNQLVTLVGEKAPTGMWGRIRDPGALTFAAVRKLVTAYDEAGFAAEVGRQKPETVRALLAIADQFVGKRKVKLPEQQLILKTRGEHAMLQMPKTATPQQQQQVLAFARKVFFGE